ncbi:MAG TPA: hypothetical protein PK735_07435 [Flavobacteriales bacterium]|nr:hypothetical protein [Flavobacteriales bacterium]
MGINIRQKGAEGERQVIKMLTPIITQVMVEMEFPQEKIDAAMKMVQRNQNQSAVGGNDLSNTFGMSIEVKRQEQLAINTWWQQCETAALRNNELPVLIFKQNNKPWRFITYGFLHAPADNGGWTSVRARVEFNEDTFKSWFRAWVKGKLLNGYEAKV